MIIARSTMKSEFLEHEIAESGVEWLKNFSGTFLKNEMKPICINML